MKKSFNLYLFLFIFYILLIQFSQGEQKYSLISVSNPTERTISEIQAIGISLEGSYLREGVLLSLVANKSEKQMLTERRIKYKTLIDDLERFYELRLAKGGVSRAGKGFGYGSMGGFYTYKEVVENLDQMVSTYPNIVSVKESIGKSNEERDIWMVKISDNPTVSEKEPQVLYTGLHHAREPESMMALIYFMWHLLENYGKDDEVTYLVNERELYFVPIVNPDGYLYNESKKPNGGGMWRKNRREFDGKVYGVDLNRNYGYKWGFDDNGSSNNSSSETYRGPGPFSEPETTAIRKFCKNKIFNAALNYHTYSNLLIYPFGYNDLETPHKDVFRFYAKDMTQFNHYEYGTGSQTVGYITNGDSDDWMYGEQGEKPMIISMTPEVGSFGDGFWPEKERIIPLAEENIYPNKYLAHVAGQNVVLVDKKILNGNFAKPGDDVKIVLSFKNTGLATAENIRVSLKSDSPYIIIPDSESNLFTLKSFEAGSNENDPIIIKISDSAPNGAMIEIKVVIDYGFKRSESVELIVGDLVTIYEETGDSDMADWNKGKWEVTGEGDDNIITDSPGENYKSNESNSLTLIKPINLVAFKRIWLTFDAKWDIEKDYDFGEIEYSLDGENWNSLSGKYSTKASGFGRQRKGHFGYHKTQNEFVHEEIDLSSLTGNERVFLRFTILSDGVSNRDGWYLDNIKVTGVQL